MAKKTIRRRGAALIAGILLSCGVAVQPVMAKEPAEAADLIFTNGKIYTVEDQQPWAEAVAIKDGKIVAVGKKADIADYADKGTEIVDLGGRLVLPSFGDIHVHPLFGALSRTRCPLNEGKTLADYQVIIAKCMAEKPGDGTVFGIGWDDSYFPPNGVPRKELLDELSTSRPLIFESTGGHTYWVNSKALQLAGITKETPNPTNGTIDRDPVTGEAVGGLQEAAMAMVEHLIPPPTQKEMQDAIIYVAHHLNSLGVTGWQDAGVVFDDEGASPMLDAYEAVDRMGKLTAHVTLALKWKNERGLDQLPGLLKTVERSKETGAPVASVKFYVDGVLPQKTAYMLEHYEGSPHERGTAQIPDYILSPAVAAVDAFGLHAYMHAIGDGAVRESLDAIATARKTNPGGTTPHLITHLNVVDPADQPRFAELNAYAQFQPTWASWYPYMELTETAIGKERMKSIYPAGGIVRAGGKLAYGSDWPVGDANPFAGLEIAVTRRTAGEPDARPLLADEGVSLKEAVESYTINIAKASGMETATGSIAAGKNADLIVLDRNIFEIPIYEVSETKVLLTLFGGKPVFGQLQSF